MRDNYKPIFRNDLLQWRLRKMEKSPEQLANGIKELSGMTIRRAVKGKSVGADKLKAIAELTGLNPKYLFDFNLTERQFHRAVVATENGVTNR